MEREVDKLNAEMAESAQVNRDAILNELESALKACVADIRAGTRAKIEEFVG